MVQVGDRVRMTGVMKNDPAPLEVGAEGVVQRIMGAGTDFEQIVVAWENGRSLMLLPFDPFEVVEEAGENA